MTEKKESPDHSTCRNCELPISWDDWSYVHDHTGFADCWLTIGGGEPRLVAGIEIRMNPDLTVTPPEGREKTMAEPIEWGPRD